MLLGLLPFSLLPFGLLPRGSLAFGLLAFMPLAFRFSCLEALLPPGPLPLGFLPLGSLPLGPLAFRSLAFWAFALRPLAFSLDCALPQSLSQHLTCPFPAQLRVKLEDRPGAPPVCSNSTEARWPGLVQDQTTPSVAPSCGQARNYPTNTFANLTVSEAVLGDPCLSLMCFFTSTLHPGAATGDD